MNFLFNIRTRRRLTQQQMAEKLCVSRPTYKLWEDSPGKIPLESLKRMIKSFDLTEMEYLEIFDFTKDSSFLSTIMDMKKEIIYMKEILIKKYNLGQPDDEGYGC